MTSPLRWALAIRPEKGVNLDLLHALALVFALAQAAGATKIIMSNNMIASQAQRPNTGVRTPRTMMTNITIARTRAIAFLLPSLLQKQREIIAPRNRELRQQSMNAHVQICMISTISHVQICMISTNSHVHIHMSHYVSLFQIRNMIV
jgi:hypothetical protein